MKTLTAATAALPILLAAGAAFAGDDLPPGALPGHCYQHVMTPAVTETYQDRVIDIPARQRTRTIPAVYGEVEKQVLVEPGRVEHHQIAPTYRTVTETEVVRPEVTRDEVIPAEYDVVTDEVMVREAHTEWRRGYGPVSDPDMPRWASDRDIVCLIQVPAEYRRETHRVLRSPERVEHITTPAITRTVTRQVVDQPGRDVVREIPPVYRAVKERVVVQPERVETYSEPAVYRIVTRTRVVTPGHLEWREYECRRVRHHPAPPPPENDGERGALDTMKAPVTAPPPIALAEAGRGEHGVTADASIARLQSALAQRGYYGGPIDGLFTIPTGEALTRFQRDRDLPLGGYNFDTAKALGTQ
jgi:hypothetical protein